MNEGGNGWINSDAWTNASGNPAISMPPFIPNVDYAIPLRLPHGRVSAVVSPHKVRILENGVLRAQKNFTIAEGDTLSLEQKGDLYVASVQHEGDEFPTPLVYWRPEPEPVVEERPSAASWWFGWLLTVLFTIACLSLLCWAAWSFATGVMMP